MLFGKLGVAGVFVSGVFYVLSAVNAVWAANNGDGVVLGAAEKGMPTESAPDSKKGSDWRALFGTETSVNVVPGALLFKTRAGVSFLSFPDGPMCGEKRCEFENGVCCPNDTCCLPNHMCVGESSCAAIGE